MNRLLKNSQRCIYLLLPLLLLVVIAAFSLPQTVSAQNQQKVVLTLFWGNGCPHCAVERPFLANLQKKYPYLEVRTYELWYVESNIPIAEKMAAAYGFEVSGVPITFVGDKHWTGYSDGVGTEIEEAIKACSIQGCKDSTKGILSGADLAAGYTAYLAARRA